MDEAGGKWQWTYDERGNVVEKCNPLGARTLYEYQDGLLTRVTDPDGLVHTLHYDSSHNLITIEGEDGAITRYTYDRLGNRIIVVNPEGKKQVRFFSDILIKNILKGRI